MVKIAIIIRGLFTPEFISGWLNRISRYTPAVTRVDECTRAETGVGAAIAAGNHAENGIWALFVQAAIQINAAIITSWLSVWGKQFIKLNEPFEDIRAIAIKIITSPIRFDSAVNIPALNDLIFW
jgi:hypothetical protein